MRQLSHLQLRRKEEEGANGSREVDDVGSGLCQGLHPANSQTQLNRGMAVFVAHVVFVNVAGSSFVDEQHATRV